MWVSYPTDFKMAVEFREKVDGYILKRVFFKCLGLKICGIQETISASAKMVT